MNNSVKTQKQDVIIPNDRRYYLREITDTVRGYHKKAEQQVELARKLYQLEGTMKQLLTIGRSINCIPYFINRRCT